MYVAAAGAPWTQIILLNLDGQRSGDGAVVGVFRRERVGGVGAGRDLKAAICSRPHTVRLLGFQLTALAFETP